MCQYSVLVRNSVCWNEVRGLIEGDPELVEGYSSIFYDKGNRCSNTFYTFRLSHPLSKERMKKICSSPSILGIWYRDN